jgi:hypothetical protein
MVHGISSPISCLSKDDNKAQDNATAISMLHCVARAVIRAITNPRLAAQGEGWLAWPAVKQLTRAFDRGRSG